LSKLQKPKNIFQKEITVLFMFILYVNNIGGPPSLTWSPHQYPRAKTPPTPLLPREM
jgi:hypothetical protein